MKQPTFAVIKALVPVVWADGEFGPREAEMLDALMRMAQLSIEDAHRLRAYATSRPRLDDLDVGALSADERRLVLENAVVLSFADGNQTMDEVVLLQSLARRLEIPEDEARQIFRVQANRSNSLLALLKSKDGAGEAT